jgi:hypothetical protein
VESAQSTKPVVAGANSDAISRSAPPNEAHAAFIETAEPLNRPAPAVAQAVVVPSLAAEPGGDAEASKLVVLSPAPPAMTGNPDPAPSNPRTSGMPEGYRDRTPTPSAGSLVTVALTKGADPAPSDPRLSVPAEDHPDRTPEPSAGPLVVLGKSPNQTHSTISVPASVLTADPSQHTPERSVTHGVATDTVALTKREPQPSFAPISPEIVAVLLARGDALLATGDIVAARLMYERVAESNSATAAVALGMTYDPRFLAQIGVRGIAADPQRATIWYRRASALGSIVATRLLTRLEAGAGH